MRWQSWAEFWAMGGYAVYVWGSLGMTVALMAWEVVQARWAHREILNQLKAEQALAQLTIEELM